MNPIQVIIYSIFSIIAVILLIRFCNHMDSANQTEFTKLVVQAKHSIRGIDKIQILKSLGLLHKALKVSGLNFLTINQAISALQKALVYDSLNDLRPTPELGVEYYQSREEWDEIVTFDNSMDKARKCINKILHRLKAKGMNSEMTLQHS